MLTWFVHTQVRPSYLFISSWNEGIAQPQTVQPGIPPGGSMGLESDAAARPVNSPTGTGFVDTFGLAFGRDVEPSVVRHGSVSRRAAQRSVAVSCVGAMPVVVV